MSVGRSLKKAGRVDTRHRPTDAVNLDRMSASRIRPLMHCSVQWAPVNRPSRLPRPRLCDFAHADQPLNHRLPSTQVPRSNCHRLRSSYQSDQKTVRSAGEDRDSRWKSVRPSSQTNDKCNKLRLKRVS